MRIRAKGYGASVSLTLSARARQKLHSQRRVGFHAISELRTRTPLEFASGSCRLVEAAEAPPRLVVNARDPHDAAEVQRHLERLQRRELQRRLDVLIPEWEERLGVRTTRIRIRAMKRKWGACRTSTGDVVFNRSLAAEPPRAIEYVVLHELAHLIEPSHDPRFQAILTEHMPDWRAVETALNGRVTTRG